MAEPPSPSDAADSRCPPHHWFVEAEPGQDEQRWTCRYCGTEQTHTTSHDDDRTWRKSRAPKPRPEAPES
jgi:hypothetical protein